MVYIDFNNFYRKIKDIFEEKQFDKNILYDMYNAGFSSLIYEENNDRFINVKNSRVYKFDKEKLSFCPKIDELYPSSYEIRNRDIFIEFDDANSFRVTKVKDNDLIVLGGHASNHVRELLNSQVNVDYKWAYYWVFPNVISKLKNVKKYDDNGKIIPVTVMNACEFLQYIKDVDNIFKVELEGNSIESNESLKTLRNYMAYLDEVEKINYSKVTLDNEVVFLDDLNKIELDYRDGFAQAMNLAEKIYKDIQQQQKEDEKTYTI